jgi:DnaJ-class molecular chaperone
MTQESLETCRHCKGSGWLGTWGRYNLLCESCLGAGFMWIERARMVISLHD